jgi:UDP-N-acetylglucosamine--N-acetylmuramyl-(pentapeptide) pyrophosphoryl-undecaprenol N-acetylglucosamine transferase
MRFVIGCGGTGGHIVPGVAIAHELIERGFQVLFIGNKNGMEAKMIKEYGFEFHGIYTRQLYRRFSMKNLTLPMVLCKAVMDARKIIRAYKPDAIFCTGGYVSGSVALAALVNQNPLYFLEPNSLPGLTTRVLSRYTRMTFTAFSATEDRLTKTKIMQSGIPMLNTLKNNQVIKPGDVGLENGKPIILITGGSQGSRAINKTVAKTIPAILDSGYQVIWQTGRTGFTELLDEFKVTKGLYMFDFSLAMPGYYQLASIAISRAGVVTLAELETNHLPAILIPLPTAAENHQYFNAMEQKKKGMALIINQKDLSKATLFDSIQLMLNNLNQYSESFSRVPQHNASKEIVSAIVDDITELKEGGKNAR